MAGCSQNWQGVLANWVQIGKLGTCKAMIILWLKKKTIINRVGSVTLVSQDHLLKYCHHTSQLATQMSAQKLLETVKY